MIKILLHSRERDREREFLSFSSQCYELLSVRDEVSAIAILLVYCFQKRFYLLFLSKLLMLL